MDSVNKGFNMFVIVIITWLLSYRVAKLKAWYGRTAWEFLVYYTYLAFWASSCYQGKIVIKYQKNVLRFNLAILTPSKVKKFLITSLLIFVIRVGVCLEKKTKFIYHIWYKFIKKQFVTWKFILASKWNLYFLKSSFLRIIKLQQLFSHAMSWMGIFFVIVVCLKVTSCWF